MKIAFSGSSGAGKTTLVKFVAKDLAIPHISGSAGDVKTRLDELILETDNEYDGGHLGVIQRSANDAQFGLINQYMLMVRRSQIIYGNDHFVTDRSPFDNITYCINQVGMHPEVTDRILRAFKAECYKAIKALDLIVYVKAVQPVEVGVEDNGSRIHNREYQRSIDALFQHHIDEYLKEHPEDSSKFLVIDFWDLETRKITVRDAISRWIENSTTVSEE